MSQESRCYTARYVFPGTALPIPNGIVVVRDKKIEAVEPHGRSCDVDYGNAAIIPGLVNGHTHLDLSGARGLIPPTDPEHFTDWLRGVIAFRRTRTPEQVISDIHDGLAECLHYGTTLIGDIASEGASWNVLSCANVRSVIYHEVLGLSIERFHLAMGDALRWIGDVTRRSPSCRAGLSPHAPYSCRTDTLQSLATILRQTGIPLTMHLAETTAELELLRRNSGPFVWFLAELGVWDPSGLARGPEQILHSTRELPNALFAHCNYLPPDSPFHDGQSLVFCPRTHAAFHHAPHPFREFRKRGVRVCLGTDSLASNPDLDILAEARLLHQQYPDVRGDELLRMVTLAGAEALGWSDETGSLEPGKSADFVVVPLPDAEAEDPHELLFANHPGKRHTIFRGENRHVDFTVDSHPSTNS